MTFRRQLIYPGPRWCSHCKSKYSTTFELNSITLNSNRSDSSLLLLIITCGNNYDYYQLVKKISKVTMCLFRNILGQSHSRKFSRCLDIKSSIFMPHLTFVMVLGLGLGFLPLLLPVWLLRCLNWETPVEIPPKKPIGFPEQELASQHQGLPIKEVCFQGSSATLIRIKQCWTGSGWMGTWKYGIKLYFMGLKDVSAFS